MDFTQPNKGEYEVLFAMSYPQVYAVASCYKKLAVTKPHEELAAKVNAYVITCILSLHPKINTVEVTYEQDGSVTVTSFKREGSAKRMLVEYGFASEDVDSGAGLAMRIIRTFLSSTDLDFFEFYMADVLRLLPTVLRDYEQEHTSLIDHVLSTACVEPLHEQENVIDPIEALLSDIQDDEPDEDVLTNLMGRHRRIRLTLMRHEPRDWMLDELHAVLDEMKNHDNV
jgi:hypothetical protein